MVSVNIYQAKAIFSKLLNEVEKTGATIVICKNGKPIADLVAHRDVSVSLAQNPRLAGANFKEDPTDGLDKSDWPENLR